MRLILFFMSMLWLALPLRAENLRQGDVEMQAALGDWLAGNEADALPALAAMAQNGNVSAQLLLGQIDRFPALQGDWLAQLSRAERIAVLRKQGGISGVNWMTTGIAQTQPIAMAWAQLWDGAATPQGILDFARLGEARAARFAALTLARRQRTGFAKIADDPDYPPSLWAYAVREG